MSVRGRCVAPTYSTYLHAPRSLALVTVAVAIALASFGVALLGAPMRPTAPRTDAPASLNLPADVGADRRPLAEVDGAIAAWSANLEAEPRDFISAVNLAELYLARLRITGDVADVARATEAAERALAVDAALAPALLLRAQAAHARHDFAAAESGALEVLEQAPDAPEALAVLGDARLELGAYELAATTYARLDELADGPAVDARFARLAAVTGRLDQARAMATAATREARAAGAPPTLLAWYHGLEAALAFQAGDLGAAEARWRSALAAWDGSAAAHAGLGRTLAATGDLVAARAALERAVEIQPMPEALAQLVELQERAGDMEAAATTRTTFLAVAELGGLNRQLSRFLADRGDDPERAVRLARADLARRNDVYAHDTLAWALLAAGRPAEADGHMQLARAHATEDAVLDYHAGMIAVALGRDDEARRLLSAALERNPGFDLLQADRAHATLAALDEVALP